MVAAQVRRSPSPAVTGSSSLSRPRMSSRYSTSTERASPGGSSGFDMPNSRPPSSGRQYRPNARSKAIGSRAGARSGCCSVTATWCLTAPAGTVRHQVAVTEQHPDLAPARLPMAFDLAFGLYWRPEDGGLLFGMSNPDEPPGEARSVDVEYLDLIRGRLSELLPVTAGLGLRRTWAATIDYTPDHLPIIGPAIGQDGPLAGVTVAAAGGAGMMWGPAVARAVADVALTGSSPVVDTTDLGLDRFDEHGHSRLATDPIALPFPSQPPSAQP